MIFAQAMTRACFRRAILSSTMLAVGLLIGGPAVAQSQSQDLSAREGGGIQDIIVTARKRAESTQTAPVAVTALSAEQLGARDLSSLERVAAAVPDLVISRANTGGGAQLAIRGIQSSFSSAGIEQSVAVIVDGSYYGNGRVINDGFLDLGRLEILKGPQALFYGKNATAGVISITTADPGDKTEAIVRAGYEFNAKEIYGEAIYSTPLTETLGIRVAVRGSKQYGSYLDVLDYTPIDYPLYDVAQGAFPFATDPTGSLARPVFDRRAPGERQITGRITLKWTPTDQFTATVKAYGTYNRGDTVNGNIVIICPRGNAVQQTPDNIACNRKFESRQSEFPAYVGQASQDPNGQNPGADGRQFSKYDSYAFNGTLEYRFDNATITSVTNYNHMRYDFFNDNQYGNAFVPLQIAPGSGDDSTFRAFSEEARILTSFDSPVNLMAGLYYQKTKRIYRQSAIFLGCENSAAPTGNRYQCYQKYSTTGGETISGYGQAIWNIVPTLEFAGGVRYTHETKDSQFRYTYVNPIVDSTGFGIAGSGIDFRPNQTFNNWSPEATLTWRVTPDVTIYGGYKTGYKSGGFSNSTNIAFEAQQQYTVFNPERVKGFEAGIKSTIWDNQLRLNLIGYSYNYTDLQQDYYNPATRGFETVNAGSTKIKGLEFEMQFAPRSLPGLSTRFTANYNDAKYQDFIAPCYIGQSKDAGCIYFSRLLDAPEAGVGANFQDLSGTRPGSAPKWTGSLAVDYDTSLGRGMDFGLSVSARYSSSYLASAFGNPVAYQPKYVSLDASAHLGFGDGRWDLAVIGRNLTNRMILTGSNSTNGRGGDTGFNPGELVGGTTPANPTPGDIQAFVMTPRTVQIQATFRY